MQALTRVALWYFQRQKIEMVLPARRRERLRDLKKVLGRARVLAHNAMQDDVGGDLFWGWCAEANISGSSVHVLDKDGSSVFTRTIAQIEEAVAGFAMLEAAAIRADRGPIKAGAPRGTGILTLEDISALARVYQRSTGQKPIMGAGAFADFLEKFLIAVGREDDTKQGYVVETLKYARKQARKKLRQMSLRQEAVGGSNPPQNS
jgi:hypothetical protein